MNYLAQARLSGLSDSANSFFTEAGTALVNVCPFTLHLCAESDLRTLFQAPNVGRLGAVHNAFLAAFTEAIACFSDQ